MSANNKTKSQNIQRRYQSEVNVRDDEYLMRQLHMQLLSRLVETSQNTPCPRKNVHLYIFQITLSELNDFNDFLCVKF